MKLCSRCKTNQDEREFHKNKNALASRCKSCQKLAAQRHKNKDIKRFREKKLAASKKWRDNNYEKSLEINRRSYKKNYHKYRDKVKAQHRICHAQLRKEVLEIYGRQCVCCGGTATPFLTLEHKNGSGNAHRKLVGRGGVYRDLKRRGWPKDDYAILCMNCNWATRNGETCPHKQVSNMALKHAEV